MRLSVRNNENYFGIPNKSIRLTKATTNDSAYHFQIGAIKTVGFKVENGSTQRDGLATKLCNVALECVIRVKSTVFHKS
jgi:hypothetical protein